MSDERIPLEEKPSSNQLAINIPDLPDISEIDQKAQRTLDELKSEASHSHFSPGHATEDSIILLEGYVQ